MSEVFEGAGALRIMDKVSATMSAPDRAAAESVMRGMAGVVGELDTLREDNALLRSKNEVIYGALDDAVEELDELRGLVLDAAKAHGMETVGVTAEELARRIAERAMEESGPSLMPEGCEWPRFEDGEMVGYHDSVLYQGKTEQVQSVYFSLRDKAATLSLTGVGHEKLYQLAPGEHVKRPVPRDRDGIRIEIGDAVFGGDGRLWDVTGYRWDKAPYVIEGEDRESPVAEVKQLKPGWLTHEEPSGEAAACGRTSQNGPDRTIQDRQVGKTSREAPEKGGKASRLSDSSPDSGAKRKESPVLSDSWEKLEEDATVVPAAYCRKFGMNLPVDPDRADYSEAFAADLIRRARALAGEGE